jgi:hypothetical protein
MDFQVTIAVKGEICLNYVKFQIEFGIAAVESHMGRKTKSFSPVLGSAKRPMDFFSRP